MKKKKVKKIRNRKSEYISLGAQREINFHRSLGEHLQKERDKFKMELDESENHYNILKATHDDVCNERTHNYDRATKAEGEAKFWEDHWKKTALNVFDLQHLLKLADGVVESAGCQEGCPTPKGCHCGMEELLKDYRRYRNV